MSTKVYPVRYDEAQYAGLEEAARRFKLTGRQKAQRRINRLYMAFFGIIYDPVAAMIMEELVTKRLKARNRSRARKATSE